jgi:8-oxo-dGTP pyrophosphatase MutT (NUDIX family)
MIPTLGAACLPALFKRERLGVAVIVQELKSKTVLTCQRVNCRDMNGMWQFPGGAIESPHETSLHAAMRELEEETGLVWPQSRFTSVAHGIGQTPLLDLFVTEFFTVECGLPAPAINKEPDKHSPWEWVHPIELCKRDLIPLAKMVLRTHFGAA